LFLSLVVIRNVVLCAKCLNFFDFFHCASNAAATVTDGDAAVDHIIEISTFSMKQIRIRSSYHSVCVCVLKKLTLLIVSEQFIIV
jgi:hypothetical protein